jgi:hypothetical protein
MFFTAFKKEINIFLHWLEIHYFLVKKSLKAKGEQSYSDYPVFLSPRTERKQLDTKRNTRVVFFAKTSKELKNNALS